MIIVHDRHGKFGSPEKEFLTENKTRYTYENYAPPVTVIVETLENIIVK